MTFAIPEEMQQSLDWLMQASISVLEGAQETDLAKWAKTVRDNFNGKEMQEQFSRDLFSAAEPLSEGPTVTGGEWDGYPIPYVLLAEEFVAFSRRPTVGQPEYNGVDHSLDLGEILVDSLGKLLEGHPISAAMLSLIKEIIQMAKSVGKRLNS